MKICFPVESDKGLDSEVFGHFGSAPIFVVIDTEANSIDTINNQDLGHAHGMCSPLKTLDGKVDVGVYSYTGDVCYSEEYFQNAILGLGKRGSEIKLNEKPVKTGLLKDGQLALQSDLVFFSVKILK